MRELCDALVVAVVRGTSAAGAVEVAEALLEGGITALEITFTTPDAPRAIRELHSRHGNRIVLGAGTVTTGVQVAAAEDAGARFLVSPGCDPDLVPVMQRTGLAVLPGVLTPSEVLQAMRLGAETVKLFPGSLGGPEYLRALRGPFPALSFVPTGGVHAGNVGEWLDAGAVAVGVGHAVAPATIAGPEQRRAVVAAAAALVAAARRDRTAGTPA